MLIESYYTTFTRLRGHEIESGRGTFDTDKAYRETSAAWFFRDDETGFVDVVKKDVRVTPAQGDDTGNAIISEMIFSN